MGLHLQRYQEIPPQPGFCFARSLGCDDESTIYGGLCQIAY